MITYKVIITKSADKDEAGIYHYITDKFGEIYADQFREKLLKLFDLLARQPFIGRPAKNNLNVRVFLFSKQNKIVYSFTGNEVAILRILHTKTNFASKY